MFPCGDDLVCIIDDREDVWQGCGNLVQVKPYHFFRHTGDINALPGLEKAEVSRLPEPANANESCTNSQNKDSKNDASELSNEAEQPLNNPSVKETNHEDEEDETMDEMKNKNKKDEDDKVTTEKDAESNVQTSTAKEDDKKKITKITASVETNKNSKQAVPKQDSNIIDDDDDDYLLYLEDILRRIHTEFYATLDQESARKSLRDIIPRVRSQVLKGLCLTFSGLIPTHQKLHQSRAYKVARAFGAEVTQVTLLYLLFL